MNIVMGGTGHVGSAVAEALLDHGEAVAIITRDADYAPALSDRGAEIIEADVTDGGSLRAAFQRGTRAFLLNPPADPSKDTDAVERATAAAIVKALDGSGLEKVVAESTYGAQPGERIGDLSVLWEFEEALRAQRIPAAINRAAYYMSNWDELVQPAADSGVLPTMLPADLMIPMVAQSDLGRAAAERMLSSIDDVGVRYVEGPARYSPADVAKAFAVALGRPVHVDVTPRESWPKAFRALGFSPEATDAYSRMTAVSVDGGFDAPEHPVRGTTTLQEYIATLVAGQA
jgi:uncharacterized protein YbjT (DUF2867 family)